MEDDDVTTLGELIEGLQIIAGYTPTRCHCVAANNAVLCTGSEGLVVSEDDQTKLEEVGWWLDPEYDVWCVVV